MMNSCGKSFEELIKSQQAEIDQLKAENAEMQAAIRL
jgi:cell division protein FtsB